MAIHLSEMESFNIEKLLHYCIKCNNVYGYRNVVSNDFNDKNLHLQLIICQDCTSTRYDIMIEQPHIDGFEINKKIIYNLPLFQELERLFDNKITCIAHQGPNNSELMKVVYRDVRLNDDHHEACILIPEENTILYVPVSRLDTSTYLRSVASLYGVEL